MFTLSIATNNFDNFEKKDFLGLLLEIADTDGDFTSEEKIVIDEFKENIGVKAVPKKTDGSTYLESFANRDVKVRKAAFFGVYSVMMADGILNEDEFRKLKQVQLCFDLSMDEYDEIIALADRLNETIDEINRILL